MEVTLKSRQGTRESLREDQREGACALAERMDGRSWDV